MRSLAVGLLGSSLVFLGCGGAAPSGAPESAADPSAGLAPPAPQASASAPEAVEVPAEERGGTGSIGSAVGTSKSAGGGGSSEGASAPAPPPPPAEPTVPRGGPDKKSRALSDERQGAKPLAAVAEATGERISRDALAGVVDANLERFRPCASGDAKVELRLTLTGGGSVTRAEAVRSQPDDARLRDCVVDVLRGLSFPRSAGSDTSTVSFQLVLSKPAF